MDLALSIILGLLHPTVAVLAHLERLLGARLEEPVLVLDVEWDAPLGGPITQKAPHCPASLTHALERAHAAEWAPQHVQSRRESLRRGCVSLQQQVERLTEAYLQAVIPLPEYQRRRHEREQ